MNTLLTLGTIAFDTIESPFGRAEKIIGGSASYIALAASQFNVKPLIISIVGGDFPKDYLEQLKKRNIDIEGIEILEGQKSFHWSGRYHVDLNTRDTLATDLNVLSEYNPIVPDSYMRPDFAILGNLHPAVQMSVINQIPNRPKLVAMDTMNYWIDNNYEELLSVMGKVDVIIVNDEEARQLSDEYSLVKAAKFIQTLGPQYIIIKKGEHGALLFYQDEVFYAPALPLEDVFDPTGAGDTFAGGFMGYIAGTGDISFENMKRAVISGSNLASFCVEKFGTQRMETLTSKDLKNRLQRFKELTHFEIKIQS
jgi:sugar/nucleoside kinase (ribokinase family)